MTGNTAPTRRRRSRRIGWLLPLAGAPVVYIAGMVLSRLLEQGGAPESLWRVLWVLAIGGAIFCVVVFFVNAVRALSPGGGRRLTPEDAEEYAEYVRLNGGVEPPAAPVTALLALAIFLTVVSLGVAALFVVNLPHTLGLAPDPAAEWGSGSSVVWLVVAVIATPAAWHSYAVARRTWKQYRARMAEVHASQPDRPVVTGRRHRTWVLPLLAIPAIILAAVLVIIGLRSVDAPRDAIRTVSVVMLVGIAVALVVLVIGIVRFLRTPPAPRVPRRPAFYEQLAATDATRRGLSPEEYGVYKGDVGSVVKPINSAGGLLFLAILLTVINVFILVLIGVGIAQANGMIPRNPDDTPLGPVEWGFLVIELLFVPVAWRYYIVERRAQKLRISRGLPKTLR